MSTVREIERQTKIDDNSIGTPVIGKVCPDGHQVYECSEPDNVYCPDCDTCYPPSDLTE
jgi:hypothetical protein